MPSRQAKPFVRARTAPAFRKNEDFVQAGGRKMKLRYAMIAMTVVLTFFEVPARTEGEADNNQPKITSGIESTPLKVGDPFLAVRSRILRSGWHPTRMQSNDDYEYFGAERELTHRKYIEFDSCSMDAGALCIFYYSKGTECLRVETVGEQLNEMKVTRWTNACPGEKL
jgi:hypothetical protein